MSAVKSGTAQGSTPKQSEAAERHALPFMETVNRLLRGDYQLLTGNHKVLDEIGLMGIDRYLDKKNNLVILYDEIYAPKRWTINDINMVLDEFLESEIPKPNRPQLVKYVAEGDWCITWRTDMIRLSDEKELRYIANAIVEAKKFFNYNFENRIIYRGKPCEF